jgi:hypothetical protein
VLRPQTRFSQAGATFGRLLTATVQMPRTREMWVRASLGVLVVAVVSATATTASAESPTALADRSFAAVTRQRSVHYEVNTSRGTGSVTTMVCDIGRSAGVQRIAFSRGGRTGHVVVRVVGPTAYVRGDSFVLNSYMGFRAAGSAKYAGRWIKIPRGNRDYATVAEAVTLHTELENLRFVSVDPPILPGRIDGQAVLVVHGTRSETPIDAAWLYVRARGAPLPLAARVTAFSGATYTTRFSRWNELIRIRAPADSVEIGATDLQ